MLEIQILTFSNPVIVIMQTNCNNEISKNNMSLEEWRYNSNLEIAMAEDQQQLVHKLELNANRLINHTNDSMLKNKSEVNHRCKVTIKDVEYKRDEIKSQKRNVEEEVELLYGYQRRVENVIKSFSNEVLEAIAECLRVR